MPCKTSACLVRSFGGSPPPFWDSTHSYLLGDRVLLDTTGAGYVCIQAHSEAHHPTDTAYWRRADTGASKTLTAQVYDPHCQCVFEAYPVFDPAANCMKWIGTHPTHGCAVSGYMQPKEKPAPYMGWKAGVHYAKGDRVYQDESSLGANEWVEHTLYNIGDYCTKDGKAYKALKESGTFHPGREPGTISPTDPGAAPYWEDHPPPDMMYWQEMSTTWDRTVDYPLDAVVQYAGLWYICVGLYNIGTPPPDATYWQLNAGFICLQDHDSTADNAPPIPVGTNIWWRPIVWDPSTAYSVDDEVTKACGHSTYHFYAAQATTNNEPPCAAVKNAYWKRKFTDMMEIEFLIPRPCAGCAPGPTFLPGSCVVPIILAIQIDNHPPIQIWTTMLSDPFNDNPDTRFATIAYAGDFFLDSPWQKSNNLNLAIGWKMAGSVCRKTEDVPAPYGYPDCEPMAQGYYNSLQGYTDTAQRLFQNKFPLTGTDPWDPMCSTMCDQRDECWPNGTDLKCWDGLVFRNAWLAAGVTCEWKRMYWLGGTDWEEAIWHDSTYQIGHYVSCESLWPGGGWDGDCKVWVAGRGDNWMASDNFIHYDFTKKKVYGHLWVTDSKLQIGTSPEDYPLEPDCENNGIDNNAHLLENGAFRRLKVGGNELGQDVDWSKLSTDEGVSFTLTQSAQKTLRGYCGNHGPDYDYEDAIVPPYENPALIWQTRIPVSITMNVHKAPDTNNWLMWVGGESVFGGEYGTYEDSAIPFVPGIAYERLTPTIENALWSNYNHIEWAMASSPVTSTAWGCGNGRWMPIDRAWGFWARNQWAWNNRFTLCTIEYQLNPEDVQTYPLDYHASFGVVDSRKLTGSAVGNISSGWKGDNATVVKYPGDNPLQFWRRDVDYAIGSHVAWNCTEYWCKVANGPSYDNICAPGSGVNWNTYWGENEWLRQWGADKYPPTAAFCGVRTPGGNGEGCNEAIWKQNPGNPNSYCRGNFDDSIVVPTSLGKSVSVFRQCYALGYWSWDVKINGCESPDDNEKCSWAETFKCLYVHKYRGIAESGQSPNYGEYYGVAEDKDIDGRWWRRWCWLRFNYGRDENGDRDKMSVDVYWRRVASNGGPWLEGDSRLYHCARTVPINKWNDPAWHALPLHHVGAGKCENLSVLASITPSTEKAWSQVAPAIMAAPGTPGIIRFDLKRLRLPGALDVPATFAVEEDPWANTTTYAVGHRVSFNNVGYVSLLADNLNHQPPNATWWRPITDEEREYAWMRADVNIVPNPFMVWPLWKAGESYEKGDLCSCEIENEVEYFICKANHTSDASPDNSPASVLGMETYWEVYPSCSYSQWSPTENYAHGQRVQWSNYNSPTHHSDTCIYQCIKSYVYDDYNFGEPYLFPFPDNAAYWIKMQPDQECVQVPL